MCTDCTVGVGSGITLRSICGYQVHQGQHGAANLVTFKVIFCSNGFYIANGYIMWLAFGGGKFYQFIDVSALCLGFITHRFDRTSSYRSNHQLLRNFPAKPNTAVLP